MTAGRLATPSRRGRQSVSVDANGAAGSADNVSAVALAHRPEPSSIDAGRSDRHILTVALEDYFQVGAFNQLIQRGQWYRFEARVEKSTRRTLELLDEFDVHATFFVLGWIAEAMPELVREVSERGHEVASKGYYHRNIRHLTPDEFRDELARARSVLQRATGREVLGYRVADGWFEPPDLWALDVLAEEGYTYDSSIGPLGRLYAHEPWRRFVHAHQHGDRTLTELPISTASLLGWHLPIAGGNYFRQFPHLLVRHAVHYWHRTYVAPYVMYFHTWEMDPDQPRIAAAPWHARIRHYRNLRKMPALLRHYLGRYRFASVAQHLGIEPKPNALATRGEAARVSRETIVLRPDAAESTAPRRVPVTVVIPCYNEELVLPYLANTLDSVQTRLRDRYDIEFLFVDDFSSDGTWAALERIFGSRPGCRIVRHSRNRGVAAGIGTGIREARTEIVCSIDCDCTYDPHELETMIPLLAEDVDLVVASPYHPEGSVRNVPGWRLFLSRGASAMYRRVLRQEIHTFTSCCRVYRRSAVVDIQLRHSGFLGIAELLGRLDLTGSRIAEHPATLEVRMLGRSKMKVLRTILAHLRLLASLVRLRLLGSSVRTTRARSAPYVPVQSLVLAHLIESAPTLLGTI